MEKVMIRIGHGYFKGGVSILPKCCPAIDAHIACWHVLIGERYGNILYRDRNKCKMDKKATEGYSENLANERKWGGVS